jgi:uncharacterized protein
MGKFILEREKDAFHFVFVAGNGDKVLHSEKYAIKSAAQTTINQVRRSAESAHHFIKKVIAGGQYIFELVNEAGELLARSESYWSPESRDYAMQIIKKEAGASELQDKT